MPEQLEALAAMKVHTDFNDLARLDRDAVRRQVLPVVEAMAGGGVLEA